MMLVFVFLCMLKVAGKEDEIEEKVKYSVNKKEF